MARDHWDEPAVAYEFAALNEAALRSRMTPRERICVTGAVLLYLGMLSALVAPVPGWLALGLGGAGLVLFAKRRP